MTPKGDTPPVNPVAFREACWRLFDWARQRAEELDEPLDGPLFLGAHMIAGSAAGEIPYADCVARLAALLRLLKERESSIGFLLRPRDGRKKVADAALLEAAAVTPVRGRRLDVEEVLAEARARIEEIESLETLLGSG